MNLIKSTGTFGFYTIISRLLGYIRDILIAIFLGTGLLADAFFVAFRIPNTFRRLFSEGTFNAAFVPSYTSEMNKGKKSANDFANNIFNLLFLGLLILTIVVQIFMPGFVSIIAPGFVDDLEKINLAISLTRITFPFLLFISLASFFSAILNSHNKFAAASAAPILLNVILIIVLLFSKALGDELVYYLSYGVSLAGFLQLIFLYYFVKKFFSLKFNFKLASNEKVKFFFRKLLPSIFSSGVTQINILVGTIIASFQAGAVSYLYYADRVYQINLAIAGIAVGTVSLPVLSKAFKSKNINKVSKIQNNSFELSLLFSIPASFGLVIASEEIISGLFGYGSFSKEDTRMTAAALKYFGYGVPAFALIKVLSNFFFARDNTKTPFYISLFIVVINVLISVSLFSRVGFLIIPIATSISTWLGVFAYLYLLEQNNYLLLKIELLKNSFKIMISTFIMSFILIFTLEAFSNSLSYMSNYKAVYLISIISFVGFIYLLSCYCLGILNLKKYKTN